MSKRGVGVVEVVLILAFLGASAWVAFPSVFSGAGRRAKASTVATAKLDAATVKADEAATAKGAEAAASVATIGAANAEAPASPASAFIRQEVPYALSLLPPPNPTALIEAERRKVAVMQGRLEEAQRLYETAAAKADRLQAERDAALAEREKALAARQAADLALEKAAAAEHARTVQGAIAVIAAVIAGAGFLYLKLTGINPAQIGTALADVAAGTSPTVALDTVLSRSQQARIARARKLASP